MIRNQFTLLLPLFRYWNCKTDYKAFSEQNQEIIRPLRYHYKRRSLSASLIGGIAETQEMLDYCGEHGIVSDIELIPIQQINEAYERVLKSDVKYRFVIDMASLPKPWRK